MPKKKKSSWKWLYILIAIIGFVGGWFIYKFYYDLNRLPYYGGKKGSLTESLKFDHIFRNYPEALLGIDMSHYQDRIDWSKVELHIKNRPVSYIILRATMGDNKDKLFENYWREVSKLPVKKGAYHYYRPNENSTKQAENYIQNVTLNPGDFPPILDIERHSTIQSRERLRDGIRNWLQIIETHYGVKPILYTGDSYFQHVFLGKGFEDYPLWIANYNNVRSPTSDYWVMWQFSEKGTLPGIHGKIDLNIMRGGNRTMENLLIH